MRAVLTLELNSNMKLLPQMQNKLSHVGVNIELARLRRKFSIEQVAERAGVPQPTITDIENGNPDISIGDYLSVLRVLGLDGDIYRIAENDPLGRKLQDIALLGE
jgi:transcriptional regulator with XRE-family HTH domain